MKFEEFTQQKLTAGATEVLERVFAADQVLPSHAHPFDVDVLVATGEMWLTCGAETRHIGAGGTFTVARDVPHAERYGAETGATLWVARRY